MVKTNTEANVEALGNVWKIFRNFFTNPVNIAIILSLRLTDQQAMITFKEIINGVRKNFGEKRFHIDEIKLRLETLKNDGFI